MSSDIFRATRFAPGHWGFGGFDGVGFYTGGQRGAGSATLDGTATTFGDPIAVTLADTTLTLAAYAAVPGGVVLTTPDFVNFYVFVRGGFDPQRSYQLTYGFGAFGSHGPGRGPRNGPAARLPRLPAAGARPEGRRTDMQRSTRYAAVSRH